MTFKEMISSKTFWLGLSTIGGAAAGFYYKQIDAPTAITAIIGGLALIFVKDAIVKSGPNGGTK